MAPERFSSLLSEARDGSEKAWGEIYRDMAPAVLGYLRANNAPEPEDVLSEAFLQVARDLPRFEGDERQFRGWVFTIAHHRLIDARRYSVRRPVQPMAEPPEPAAEVAESAADEALAQMGAEDVRRVLATLSPDQRNVLLLRVIGDLTVPQVAEALGKRQGAVKALQRRGLAAIRRQLGATGGVTL